MSHDPFCLMSKPKPKGATSCICGVLIVYCICGVLYSARKDEREQAAKRVRHLIDNPMTIDPYWPVESLVAAVKGEQE